MNDIPTPSADVVMRSPADLTPHVSTRHLVGRWAEDSEEMLAMRRSIRERGVLHPLLITPANEIMDGVTRWMAAKALQIMVPCRVREESEALEIVIETELHRRHHTKSQIAFRLAPRIGAAWEAAWERKNANLMKSQVVMDVPKARTVEEYALQLGMSAELLRRARELHQLFDAHRDLLWEWDGDELEAIGVKRGTKLSFRDYFTAKILDPTAPMGLGGALAGLKQKISQLERAQMGRPHRGGRPAEESEQLRLFRESWTTVGKRWEYWTHLDEQQREAAVHSLGTALETAPTDVLVTMKRRVDTLLKERSKAEEIAA